MGNQIGSSSDGMGNFFDLDVIVDKLTAYQQRQIKRLENKEDIQKTHLSVYNNIQSYLTDNLQNDLHALQAAFNQLSYQASSSNSSIVTPSIIDNHNIYPTTHTLTVTSLAQAESMATALTFADKTVALNINEALTFTIGSSSFSTQVNTTDSLENIRDNINQNLDNIGVTASILTTTATDGSAQSTLIISSNQTGTANAVTISGDSANQFEFTNQMTAAQDAVFTFDEQNVVRSSNYVDDVIDGLAFNLLATTPTNGSVSITINSQPENRNNSILTAMNAVIMDYNKFLQFIDQSRANRETRDDTLSLIKLAMSNAVDTPYSGSGSVSNLWQIGVLLDRSQTVTNSDGSTYKTYGELKIKDEMFTNMLVNNFSSVQSMFLDPNSGFINNVNTAIQQLITPMGPIDGITTQLNTNIRYIDDKILSEQQNLRMMQDDLRGKYSAANDVIRQLEQTGNFLDLQLSTMNFNYGHHK